MENILKRHQHTVKLIVLLTAAYLASMEYIDYQKERRVDRAFVFHDRYAELDNIINIEKKIGKIGKIYSQETKEANKKYKKPTLTSSLAYKKIYTKQHNKLMSVNHEINFMVDYYESIQICIEENLCHKKTAERLLSKNANTFSQNICIYVASYRAKYSDDSFAEKLFEFAEKYKKLECPIDEYKIKYKEIFKTKV